MDNIITIILAVFASGGLWTFLTELWKSKKKAKTPMEKMILALVRDKLCFLSKKYIKLKGIPEDELEVFKKIGESYLEAGGNSEVKKLYEDASKLPVIIEE